MRRSDRQILASCEPDAPRAIRVISSSVSGVATLVACRTLSKDSSPAANAAESSGSARRA